MRVVYFSKILLLLILLTSCGRHDGSHQPSFLQGSEDSDIVDLLEAIPGLTIVSESTTGGLRTFELRYEQPVDHNKSDGAMFNQRLVLLHRSQSAPMVLQTSGYSIFGVGQAAITSAFATNQIQVEHRFFSDSRPKTLDWSKLDIWQSANDFHRITAAFKSIYKTNWVGTGASKGGMTSVYHRRFFPDDLNGTVADVAPLSFSTDDERYIEFVENVGGDEYATCRAALEDAQVAALAYRKEFNSQMTGSYDQLGSTDVAFEHAVLEMPFAFWQYGSPGNCNRVPTKTSGFSAVRKFFESNGDIISGYADANLQGFTAYFLQAAVQLGGPAAKTSHITKSLKHLDTYKISTYTPKGVDVTYDDAAAMRDVEKWVKEESQGVMFIYGQYDPWSAGAFTPGQSDSYLFVAPQANHSASYRALSTDDRVAATKVISKWLGKGVMQEFNAGENAFADDRGDNAAPTDGRDRSLEDIEFAARKRLRL